MIVHRFILPITKDVEGMKKFRRTLAKEFGGYTATPCYGGWVNDQGELIEESNWMYEVAACPKRSTVVFLLAAQEAVALGQEALYWECPLGSAEIFNLLADEEDDE